MAAAPDRAGFAAASVRALLLAGLAAPAAAQDYAPPSTEARVPGLSVVALLGDMTSLEGLVWFEEGEARYCLTGIGLACGGARPLSGDGLVGASLSCSGGLTGEVEVSSSESHDGTMIPKRAAGEMSDGRSLVALFGPFRLLDGAECRDLSPSTAPEETL